MTAQYEVVAGAASARVRPVADERREGAEQDLALDVGRGRVGRGAADAARHGVAQHESDRDAAQDLQQRGGREHAGDVAVGDLGREPGQELADLRLLPADQPDGRGVHRRIAQQVQRQLLVGDEPRPAVEAPDHIGERLEALLEGVARDHRRLERVDQLLHALLECREEQRLTRAEVVLDHTPGDTGALGDPVRAHAVETLLEDAVDRGVDQPRARRVRGGRG